MTSACIRPTPTLSNVTYSAVGILDQPVVGDDRHAAGRALATDGRIAVPSWARMMRTLAPWAMRFSTLLACVSAEDQASVEM